MVEYDKTNDYELISLAEEQNETAYNFIVDKYKPILENRVKHFSKSVYGINGVDESDLMQQAYMALFKAIETFNEAKDACFYTYVILCVDRKIQSFIRSINIKRNSLINDSSSLDSSFLENENDLYNVVVPQSDIFDLSDLFVRSEEFKDFVSNFKIKLSELEKQIFVYKLDNLSTEEIIIKLNSDKRQIENAITRIRNKYKRFVD